MLVRILTYLLYISATTLLAGCASQSVKSKPDQIGPDGQSNVTVETISQKQEYIHTELNEAKLHWAAELGANASELQKYKGSITAGDLVSPGLRVAAKGDLKNGVRLLKERIVITDSLPHSLLKIAESHTPEENKYINGYVAGILIANQLADELYELAIERAKLNISYIDLADRQTASPRLVNGHLEWSTNDARKAEQLILQSLADNKQKIDAVINRLPKRSPTRK